ncbi:reverse transcriptase [Phytophthora megakarya]|uniref:Reverse transcriptase n=1 Tax=Phytophthora megakarya TaxID=4795 RepID=A0A225W909_9STRA|nr:reverse transcriptase [Phytophthora megakarya]
MFARRTLKSNELNYGIAEKEVLALLRILDLNYNILVGRPIRVLTRNSTLAWLFRKNELQGRLGQRDALLSPWMLEIVKRNKGEDEILGTLAASITPRSEVDKALISIAPKKELRNKIQALIPTVRLDEDLYVASLDGSARVVRDGGAYSAILWKLLEWTVAEGRSDCEIDCKVPGLTLLRQKPLDRLRIWPDHELVHVERDWNGSTDSLATAALQRQFGDDDDTDSEVQDLFALNRQDIGGDIRGSASGDLSRYN